jgi:Flp pilus assembly protein TadD
VPDAGARAANGDAGGAGPARRAFEKGRERFLANEMDAAIEHFERAATLRPDDPKVRKQLGRAYMRAGRVERAVAAYRRYLQLAPDAPDRAIVEQIIRQRDEG